MPRIGVTGGLIVAFFAVATSGVAARDAAPLAQLTGIAPRGAVLCVDSIATLPSVGALHSGYRTILGRVALRSWKSRQQAGARLLRSVFLCDWQR